MVITCLYNTNSLTFTFYDISTNAASPGAAQLNGHHMSMSATSPDPFSNVASPAAEAQNLFNNDDAFAAFNKDVSASRPDVFSVHIFLKKYIFVFNVVCVVAPL